MSIKLCFNIVLICATAHIFGVTAFQSDCPSQCTCNEISYATYEYNCNPTVSLQDSKTYYYGPNKDYDDEARRTLSVTCSDVTARAYHTLSTMDMGNVQHLEFINCALPAGSFASGANSLKELEFTNEEPNAIGSITTAHFDGIDRLEKLLINVNSTQEWPNDLLDRLVNVTQQLSLQVPNINANVFKKFANLYKATIGYNLTDKDIDDGIFVNGKHLTTLTLIGNQFDQLKLQPFQLLTEIKTLTLDSNNIGEIEANAFSAFEKLEIINFVDNHIASVAHGLFSKNTKLWTIKIDGGHLNALPEEMLANLTNLYSVYIHADLTAVPGSLFHGSSNIKIVDLSNNSFTTLPSELFAGLSGIHEIDLSHNMLISLPANLFNGTSSSTLYRLNLKHNGFQSVAAAISKRPCSVIDLTYNRIANIFPEDAKVLEEYITIDLAHNGIKHINASKWILDRDRSLNGKFQLHENPIDCSCDSTAFLRLLKQQSQPFELNNARCATPQKFAGRSLEYLRIEEIDCGLTYHYVQPIGCTFTTDDWNKTVLIMNCSNAGLTDAPPVPSNDQISHTFKAIDVYIENNSIKSLPEVYKRKHDYVRRIYARNNSISELNYANIPINLQTIDVSHNRLTNLSINLVYVLNFKRRSLKNILWNDNPWTFEYPIDLPNEFLQKEWWNTGTGGDTDATN